MNFLRRYILLFVVFLTGASVLIVEVTATRVLSPYFGNTIYTVSSVIGVILAALSFGYYLGGILADRRPSLKWFFGIILASGLSVFLLQLLILFYLPEQGYKLPIDTGPLILSTILFFLPSFLLGTLSPFAIKLQELRLPDEGIGRISGEVFFWSTLGSIFGSLFAGFFLIPHFGISQIILGIGFVLIILGLSGLVATWKKGKIFIKITLIASAIWIGLAVSFFSFQTKADVLYIDDGVYEKIIIFDDQLKGRPARFFQQDRSLSGAMYLESEELVFDYTKYYSLYRIFKPQIKEVLFIGGGAYSTPKAILKELPEVNVDVCEIEPTLLELAKKYFKVPDSPRLKNYVEDGRRFLYDTDKKYDLIFSDVYYSLFSIPSHFTTKEFFQIAYDKLSSEGIFIANLIGSFSRQTPSLVFSEIKTFQSVFENSYFFAVETPRPSRIQNIIFVGYKSDRKIDFEDPKIKESENEIIRSLDKKLVDLGEFDLSPYTILTDNYAPVEYLTADLVKKYFAQNTHPIQ